MENLPLLVICRVFLHLRWLFGLSEPSTVLPGKTHGACDDACVWIEIMEGEIFIVIALMHDMPNSNCISLSFEYTN